MVNFRSGFSGNSSSKEPASQPSAMQQKIAQANGDTAKAPIPEVKKPETVVVDGRTLVERPSPELFSFSTPGDFVKGVLSAIDRVEVKGKPTIQFTVDDAAENKTYKILGTYDLNQKIKKSDIGSFLQIVYKGENKEVKKGDNFLRMFGVAFEEKTHAATFTDGSQITDADIPF